MLQLDPGETAVGVESFAGRDEGTYLVVRRNDATYQFRVGDGEVYQEQDPGLEVLGVTVEDAPAPVREQVDAWSAKWRDVGSV